MTLKICNFDEFLRKRGKIKEKTEEEMAEINANLEAVPE
mgnify:CR=1 FL=1